MTSGVNGVVAASRQQLDANVSAMETVNRRLQESVAA